MGKGGSQKTEPKDTFPIVGIGMSAGGLEIATKFLNAMPPDSGMGFVIVQHLDPTRNSLLAELLAKQTKMPVVEIEDGHAVEPDRVHVIVPAKTLLIEGGILRLSRAAEPRGQRHPIDKFFTALAEDQKAKAIAIVLSRRRKQRHRRACRHQAGRRDVHRAGPETAKFDPMPRHADRIGRGRSTCSRPKRCPRRYSRYAGHSYVRTAARRSPEGPVAKGRTRARRCADAAPRPRRPRFPAVQAQHAVPPHPPADGPRPDGKAR